MKTGLYIGRFQPFHLGHFSIVKKIIKTNDLALIVVGSAKKCQEQKNPLTASERQELIKTHLLAEKIPQKKFLIFTLDDINNSGYWPIYLTKQLPPYQEIHTGSQIVKDCFTGKYSTKEQKKLLPNVTIKNIIREIPISSTKIRR